MPYNVMWVRALTRVCSRVCVCTVRRVRLLWCTRIKHRRIKKETLTCELEFNHAGAVKPDVAGKKPELLLNVLRSHTLEKKKTINIISDL